ncbi:right-handed parallel beta-helix repeat-containing protein [Myxococcota bacterium]|nr:right-handed parallel beta-helix repeat-containing protein [Myxococcota bacterium]
MSRAFTVPGDFATLADAVAQAQPGDVFELRGQVTAGRTELHVPITLRGGTLVGTEVVLLRLLTDVTLDGVTIQNPHGHGVVCMAGIPELVDLRIDVNGTAIACGASAAPRVLRTKILRCAIGVTVQDDAKPYIENLTITSMGTGLFFKGRGAGLFNQVGILAGNMPAIEVSEQAAPELVGVLISASGAGGLFIHGTSTPRFTSTNILRTTFDAVEVRGAAAPVIDGLRAEECYKGGLLLSQDAGGTYLEVEVRGCMQAALTVGDRAHPEIERMVLTGSSQVGARLLGACKVEAIDLKVLQNLKGGVELGGDARLDAEDLVITENLQFGLVARDRAQLNALRAEIRDNRGPGLVLVQETAATLRGGNVTNNVGGDIVTDGAAQLTQTA